MPFLIFLSVLKPLPHEEIIKCAVNTVNNSCFIPISHERFIHNTTPVSYTKMCFAAMQIYIFNIILYNLYNI